MDSRHELIRKIARHDHFRDAEQLLEDIVYSLDNSAIVAVTDRTGKILYANEFFSKISRYPIEELLGADQSIVNSGYHPSSFFKEMWRTIGRGQIWQGDICNRAKDGSVYWVDTTIVPFLNERGIPYQYISIRHNITEQKANEAALQRQVELYQLITGNSGDYIIVMDTEGTVQYPSPSIVRLLGGDAAQFLRFLLPEDRSMLQTALAAPSAGGADENAVEFRLRTPDARLLQMRGTLSRIRTDGGFKGCYVAVFRDVTAEMEREQLISDLASTDQLTGLLNRRAFLKELFAEVEEAKMLGGRLGLVFMNIDKLRYANETFGHDRGDEILKQIAARLTEHLGNTLCGRTAGDEFAFVLKDEAAGDRIGDRMQAIHRVMEMPVEVAGQLYTPSISCGLSVFPDHAIEVPGLITTTEQAMQFVKQQGGSDCAIFVPDMYSKSLDRIILENELRKSVKEKHFVLEYQPKVDLAKGTLVGFEALVRWEHPDLGRIPPDKFIGLAEETKIIIPIGEWVLEEAFLKAKELQRTGRPPLTVAANLSAVQLESPDLIPFVKELTARTAIDPALIELEVTESAFADRLEMGSVLRQLRSLGFAVSIDDFGTGFSSFSYIHEFPAETLKIDKSFIRDIEENDNSRAIVQALITMADTAGLNVIAEGIETAGQAAILKDLGCRQGQGFYYSRPLPASEVPDLIRKSVSAPLFAE